MPRIHALSCHICVPTVGVLPEYTDPDADDAHQPVPTRTVYIAAREGADFSIDLTVHAKDGLGRSPTADRLSMSFEFDGVREQPCQLTYVMHAFPYTQQWNSQVTRERAGAPWQRRRYTFARVTMTEDRQAAGQLAFERVQTLGEIRVIVRRFHSTSSARESTRIYSQPSDDGADLIHEKAAKGRDIAQRVKLSKPEAAPTPNVVQGTYLDTEQNPYVVFRFRYRSERALESLGVIHREDLPAPAPLPRAVSAAPGGRNDDVKGEDIRSLTRAELEEEVRRLRKIKSTSEGGGGDSGTGSGSGSGGVKRERARSPAGPSSPSSPSSAVKKRRARKHVETIDLTDL